MLQTFQVISFQPVDALYQYLSVSAVFVTIHAWTRCRYAGYAFGFLSPLKRLERINTNLRKMLICFSAASARWEEQAPHIKYIPNASMAIETCQIKSYYVYHVSICLPSRVLGIFWVFPPGPTNRKHDPLLDRGWCTKVIEIIKTQTCTGNAFTTSNSEWWGKQWHCGVQQSRILYILLCFRLRLLLVSTQRDWCNAACAELNGGNSNTVLCRVPHAKVSAVEPDPRDNRHIKSHRNIFPSTFHEFKKGLNCPRKTNWTLKPPPHFPNGHVARRNEPPNSQWSKAPGRTL